MIIHQLAAGGAAALFFFLFFSIFFLSRQTGVNQSQTREALAAPPGEAAPSSLAASASAAVSLQRNPSRQRGKRDIWERSSSQVVLLSRAELCWLVSELVSETPARFRFSLCLREVGVRNYSVITASVFHSACLLANFPFDSDKGRKKRHALHRDAF